MLDFRIQATSQHGKDIGGILRPCADRFRARGITPENSVAAKAMISELEEIHASVFSGTKYIHWHLRVLM